MPLVEQELLTLPEHLRSLPVLVGFVLLDFSMCSVLQIVVRPFLFILIDGFLLPLLVSSHSSYHRRTIPVVISIQIILPLLTSKNTNRCVPQFFICFDILVHKMSFACIYIMPYKCFLRNTQNIKRIKNPLVYCRLKESIHM